MTICSLQVMLCLLLTDAESSMSYRPPQHQHLEKKNKRALSWMFRETWSVYFYFFFLMPAEKNGERKWESKVSKLVVLRLVIATGSTGTSTVQLAGDGVGNVGQLLLLLVKVLGVGSGSYKSQVSGLCL